MSNIIDLGTKKFDLSSIKKQTVEEDNKEDNKETPESIKEIEESDDFLNSLQNFKYDFQPPEPILTPEEARSRREKIIKIQRYIQNFDSLLFEFKNIDYSSKKVEELDNYLEEIRLIVTNKNSNNLLGIGYTQGIGLIESMAPYLNMDLQGLSAICARNEAINDCLKEISIEYLNTRYMKPTYRIAILTAGIAIQLNSVNKSNKIINSYLDKKLDEDLKNKYNDI